MVFSLALSPDGKTLAGGEDEGIILWSMAPDERIRTLTGEGSNIAHGTSLAWLQIPVPESFHRVRQWRRGRMRVAVPDRGINESSSGRCRGREARGFR